LYFARQPRENGITRAWQFIRKKRAGLMTADKGLVPIDLIQSRIEEKEQLVTNCDRFRPFGLRASRTLCLDRIDRIL